MRWGMTLCGLLSCTHPTSAPPSPAPSAAATSPPASLPDPMLPKEAAPFTKLRISTDPEGASVKEGGYELCNDTPCEITYKGADADPTRDHELYVFKTGYGVELRTVRIGDSPVTVKLTRAQQVHPSPPATRLVTLPPDGGGPYRRADDLGDLDDPNLGGGDTQRVPY